MGLWFFLTAGNLKSKIKIIMESSMSYFSSESTMRRDPPLATPSLSYDRSTRTPRPASEMASESAHEREPATPSAATDAQQRKIAPPGPVRRSTTGTARRGLGRAKPAAAPGNACAQPRAQAGGGRDSAVGALACLRASAPARWRAYYGWRVRARMRDFMCVGARAQRRAAS